MAVQIAPNLRNLRIKSTSIRKTSNQRLCATFDRLGKYSIAFEIARLKHAHGFRRILGSEASICINFPISRSSGTLGDASESGSQVPRIPRRDKGDLGFEATDLPASGPISEIRRS